MKWAMSDDYAALITTIILAVLLIGTVQTYSLLRAWTNSYAEIARRYVEAWNRAGDAARNGSDPDDEDLEQISIVATPRRLLLLAWPAMAAGVAWLSICALLVILQIKVLLWSATHEPARDPQLAKWTFYATSGSVVLLLIEGLARAVLQGISGIWQSLNNYTLFGSDERDVVFRALGRQARRRNGDAQ
jgi:hypothetical protein